MKVFRKYDDICKYFQLLVYLSFNTQYFKSNMRSLTTTTSSVISRHHQHSTNVILMSS